MPEIAHREERQARRFRGRARAGRTVPALLVEGPLAPGTLRRDALGRVALLGADLAAAGAAILVPVLLLDGVAPLALLPLAVVVVFIAMGLYRRDELLISARTLDEAPQVLQAATMAAVGALLGDALVADASSSAALLALTLLTLTATALLLRAAARLALRRLLPPERCLVAGSAEVAARLAERLAASTTGNAALVGRVELGAELTAQSLGVAVRRHRAHRVVIAGEGGRPEIVHAAIQSAKALGVKVSVLPRMFEVVGSNVAFDDVDGITVLGVRRFGLSRRQRTLKRAFDVVGSVALLVLLAPVMAAVAVAVKLTSPGPVLFRQVRVGRDGRLFRVIKFRSMVADAEERKASLREANEADGLFKIDGDPRITGIGSFLRRTALDELPQLVCVLRGEMSIVGPRPLVVDEDQRIEGHYRRRLHLTPGMTGPWQVLGSARVPLREMVSIDYLYVANWSLWGDVKILLRTIPIVALRRGQ
jgi:exopolysaccharide biosynthesis polyprenyl glycosylphosphotransferase